MNILLVTGQQYDIKKTFKCEEVENTCFFKDIHLSENDYYWKPEADNPDLIDKVNFVNCKIPVLTVNICNYFVSLRELNINGQYVQEVMENAFHDCAVLSRIYLQNNLISKIHDSTFTNVNIFRIYLDGNRIENLDCWLGNLVNLTVLSVSANNLTEFNPEIIKENKKLKVLHLNSNDLSDVDVESLIENHPKLRVFYFDDNEISCVRVVEIIKLLRENEIKTGNFSDHKVRYYKQMGVFGGYKCNGDVEWMASNNRKEGLAMKNVLNDLTTKEKSIQDRLSENEIKLDLLYSTLMKELNEQNALIQSSCSCSSTTTEITATDNYV